MRHTEQRKNLRSILAGSRCTISASVYDPLSARIAESVGYGIGMLAGSVASNTTLAAPDLIILTLSEIAAQIRRIMRVSNLSLVIDADHGYGNALNVMRTIQELEHVGVSGLTIEDTVLPKPFGQVKDAELISSQEMVGKLRAAVAARSDPELVIIGRTTVEPNGVSRAIERLQAYASTGIDMIFLHGTVDLDQLEIIHAAVNLPIMIGAGKKLGVAKREDLAVRGVRILIPYHNSVTIAGAVKALQETYMHLFNGGAPSDLKSKIASPQEMERIVNSETYEKWRREYLH